MNETQTFERISRETLEEHRQIHFYLDQIEVTLKGIGQGRSDDEPLQRLAAQLEGLKEQLIEHYRAEQHGLFRAIAELLPDFAWSRVRRGDVGVVFADGRLGHFEPC